MGDNIRNVCIVSEREELAEDAIADDDIIDLTVDDQDQPQHEKPKKAQQVSYSGRTTNNVWNVNIVEILKTMNHTYTSSSSYRPRVLEDPLISRDDDKQETTTEVCDN
ncbi:hypothetical protein ACET3Z_024682 [Daucus carota]